MDITSILGSAAVELPPDNIYHLPSGLTRLQRDLVEVLLELHRGNLQDILGNDNTVKKEIEQSGDVLSSELLLQMLVNNWQHVLSHPFLLVEHFIPKKLILMESTNTLIRDSGKFAKFDELINKLQKFSYNVIVVARTMKELDLIESYVLGRKLNYKRYTGASLYEINTYQESTNRQNSSHQHSTSYRSKRSDDYVPRVSKNNLQLQYLQKNPKDKLTLHLISSTQLQSMSFPTNLKFQFIISFDPFLTNLTYLRQLQSFNDKLIPMIKLVVFNSIEHWKLLGETDPKNLISRSIVSRNQDSFSFEVPVEWLENYQTALKWPIELGALPAVPKLDEIKTSLHTEDLKKIKLDSQMTTIEYRQNLTGLIKNNISQISSDILKRNIKLDESLAQQSKAQLIIEESNVGIGENVKLKQSLETEFNALSKRVARLESDLLKLENLKTLKNELLALKVDNEIEIDNTELEELNNLNEKIRLDYQSMSSKLLESSIKLKFVTNENEQLHKKLQNSTQQDISNTLNQLYHTRQNHTTESLSRQNQFLSNYNNKINAIVRNNNIVDSGGRATNGRLSRSSTPRI